MTKISASDIMRRLNNRRASFDPQHVIRTKPRLFTESGIFCKENALDVVYSLEKLSSDTNIAFDKALDTFEEICLNLNESECNTICDFLLENVDKVRDANQLINSINHRNSRIKTRISTKINNKISNVNGMINYYIDNLDKTIPKPPSAGDIANTTKQESFIESLFNKLSNRAHLDKECDRILENYNKLCKRFDIDKLIAESTDIYDTSYTIASYVDTYPIVFGKAYNIALEAAYYGLSKHYIQFKPKDIISGVTDYYIFNRPVNESFTNDLKNAANNSLIFDDKDFDITSFMYDNYIANTSIDQIDPESYANNYGCVVKETLTQTIKDGIKNKRSKEDVMTDEVDDMLAKFRDSCSKNANAKTNETSFKSLINKIFATNVNTIIYGLPNLLTLTVSGFIIGGSFAISVPLGILATITAGVLKLEVDRHQCDKILKIYDKEYSKAKKKADSAKDETSKEKWTKYKDALKSDVDQIRIHFNSLFSDEEKENMDSNKNYSFDNDYDFDDDFDFDFDFDESTIIDLSACMLISEMMSNISEAIVDPSNLNGIIADNIVKLSSDSIDSLADFVIANPAIIERRDFKDCMESYRAVLRKHKDDINNYVMIDTINNDLYKLENTNISIDDKPTDLKSILIELFAINSITSMKNSYYFNEMNFTNTLKLAANNLKRAAVNLTDKEKQASNSIDIAVNSITKGIEKALMVENREAVIRGSIIPSASKCIKIALAFGVAWAISPAIAIIGSLGAFATSNKLRDKERQIILDDIELELKMCDRYIKQAEDKNDLKKVRELEKIQRNLQRQEQRIRYKMKVEFNQDVPDVKQKDYD